MFGQLSKGTSLGRGAALLVAVAVAWMCVGTVSAQAEPASGRWARFGADKYGGGYTVSHDRAAVREWEMNPPRGYPTLSRDNLAPTKVAIKHYAAVVKKGGWRPIPVTRLEPGSRGPAVYFLTRRLELSGDLVLNGRRGYLYTYSVEMAVKRFQMRNGLSPTGIADKVTILAMNVPADARLRQLKLNLGRIGKEVRAAGKRYVAVNIPAAQIEVVENGRMVSRHAAVVGKIDRRTPVLRSRIHEINFNPYWTVPASIVRKDLVPKARRYARRGKDVLSTYRIDAYDGRGRKLDPSKIDWSSESVYRYRYRQQPWKDNSMGFVKINFRNRHAVYMHDTPSKSLFGRNYRAHSSGCVRVQHVQQLVSWLLDGNQGWDIGRVSRIKETGERKDVRLKRRVPVHFVYVTAWANPDGVVHFRRDLYRRDGVGVTASAY